MAQIRAIQARGLLSSIARIAKANALDMLSAIQQAQDAVLTDSYKTGRVYSSTAGNGQSVSFQQTQTYTSSYTPELVAAQYQEFVEIYQFCVSQGLITDATDIDTDLAEMLADDRLQTVTRRYQDITGIRFPNGLVAAP